MWVASRQGQVGGLPGEARPAGGGAQGGPADFLQRYMQGPAPAAQRGGAASAGGPPARHPGGAARAAAAAAADGASDDGGESARAKAREKWAAFQGSGNKLGKE